jgi:hypothetical protein
MDWDICRGAAYLNMVMKVRREMKMMTLTVD